MFKKDQYRNYSKVEFLGLNGLCHKKEKPVNLHIKDYINFVENLIFYILVPKMTGFIFFETMIFIILLNLNF